MTRDSEVTQGEIKGAARLTRIAIEQAIARDEPVIQTLADLNVSYELYVRVQQRLLDHCQ